MVIGKAQSETDSRLTIHTTKDGYNAIQRPVSLLIRNLLPIHLKECGKKSKVLVVLFFQVRWQVSCHLTFFEILYKINF